VRTLLILDGLEPLQNPPGPQEGRVHDPSLQAFLRELAAFNKGLCVITTRLPVADIASDLIELSTRQNFASWLAGGEVLRGWARCALGDTPEGVSWILAGIDDWQATGSMLLVPYLLALKAEGLHLADRASEAPEAIIEAEAVIERREERWWCAELRRLRGVFLS